MAYLPKPQLCRNGCDQMIYFDKDSKVGHPSSEKWIPLNFNKDSGIYSGEVHNCPKNPYRNGNNNGSIKEAAATAPKTVVAAKIDADPLNLALQIKIIQDKLDQLLAAVGDKKPTVRMVDNAD